MIRTLPSIRTIRTIWTICGRRAALLAGLATLFLATSGCFFNPREAETPSGDEIRYLPRTSPANVWENAQLSLTNADVQGWDDAIGAEFHYYPDSETEQAYPSVGWGENWTRENEISFVTRWYGSNVSIAANLRDTDISTDDPSGTSTQWELIYFLRVTDRSTGSETRYRAHAFIDFQLEGNFWYISGWRDANGESDPDNPAVTLEAMGRLRGAFGSS